MASDAARAIAMSPFTELDLGTFLQRTDLGDIALITSEWPIAGVVVPIGAGPDDVEAAVARARSAAAKRGKSIVVWYVAPDHRRLVPELERLGLAQADAPGFESVETAMLLERRPAGAGGDGVEVRPVATYEDFVAAGAVLETAFGLPSTAADASRRLWTEYDRPGNTARQFVASVDGAIVGTAFAVFGAGAVNLFGGGVLPGARGRGVYRALTQARWELAVEGGSPVLTVQAGRESKPILEGLGFEPVGEIAMFVDAPALGVQALLTQSR